jgi:translation initiation factor IF-3
VLDTPSLVSQQRWQIWEQAEKQVLRQMEFEKMSYEAQLDAYAKQKAQLQKSLLKTQEVKDKIKNGDYTFSQGLAACQAGTPKRRRRN